MKIALGSDHGGFALKEKIKAYLIEKGYEIEDFGTYSTESVDYPAFALKAALAVSKENVKEYSDMFHRDWYFYSCQ